MTRVIFLQTLVLDRDGSRDLVADLLGQDTLKAFGGGAIPAQQGRFGTDGGKGDVHKL